MFCFPDRGPMGTWPLSFHKLCVPMHVNKKKFERNTSSLEYYMLFMYHMTCIWKQSIQAKEVYWHPKTGSFSQVLQKHRETSLTGTCFIVQCSWLSVTWKNIFWSLMQHNFYGTFLINEECWAYSSHSIITVSCTRWFNFVCFLWFLYLLEDWSLSIMLVLMAIMKWLNSLSR